jgi:RNA recognition motif-containing protein
MWVRSNKGNVFVGNLPPDFSDERLAEAFDPFGIVLTAVVARDPATGARLRYGFVDIATEKAASRAIGALDGSEIDGCKLNVRARQAKTASKKPGAPARRPPLRVIAANRFADDAAAGAGEMPPRSAPDRPSQSQRALASAPEIEPPPRRDFEIVRRPIRRTTPSFQVERRPLPRRV